MKFTEPGGAITISCGAHDSTVSLRVSGTGIGIPADKLGAIFDPFVQVNPRFNIARSDRGKHARARIGLYPDPYALCHSCQLTAAAIGVFFLRVHCCH